MRAAARAVLDIGRRRYHARMRPTPFYFFFHLPPGAKKPKRTTYRMTIEDAAVRLPGAWPDELSKEIRNLPCRRLSPWGLELQRRFPYLAGTAGAKGR